MPKQRISIGKYVLESPELEWEDILKIASQLRKIARWDPDNKTWDLNWKLYTSYFDVAKNLSSIKDMANNDYIRSYLENLLDLLGKILDKTPKVIEKNNRVLLLVMNCDPFSIVKRIKANLAGIKLIFEKIDIENLGLISAPYISLPKFSVKEFLRYLEEYSKLDCFDKTFMLNYIKESGKVIYIYSKDKRNLTIIFPSNIFNLVAKDLREICKIEYYISDPREGLIKRETIYYKEYRRGDSYIVKTPKFVYPKLIHLLDQKAIPYKIGEGILEAPKEINVSGSPTLYDYQEQAFLSWVKNGYWGTIVIPTGGGKTYLGLAAIARIKKPTLILVPNLWLLYQWIERIQRILKIPKKSIGVMGGGEKRISEITVSTYQSASKNIDQFSDKFHVVVFDEAHHVPATTFKKAALYLAAPYRMALSATPTRADKNEILLFKLAGKIVYEITYPELVKRGFVAPLVVRKIYVELPRDIEREYKRIQLNLRYAYDELARKQIVNKLIELCRDNPAKLQVIKEIIKKHKDEKIFIFAGSIDFAKKILNEIKQISRAALLTSETKKSEEKRIIRNFMNGVIRVLILVKKGEEGVDVGDASVAIIAGGTKQKRETIQRIGRILRGGNDKLAWVYEIVTAGTIEEKLSKGRKIENLVRGLEKMIRARYEIEPYKVIYWK